MKNLIFILFLLVASTANSQEVISKFDDSTLPVLNDNLKDSNRRILDLENGGLENFETATDDGVVVGNGTTFDTKVLPSCSTAATSKLLYNSTTNAFSCGTDTDSYSDVQLVSTTTWTNADASTGNIAISKGNRYLFLFTVTAIAGDLSLFLNFNDDLGASNYSWVVRELSFATTPAEADTGDDADGDIQLGTFDGNDADTASGSLLIDATATNDNVIVTGSYVTENAAGVRVLRTIGGYYGNASTLTHFEFNVDGSNFTGTGKLYQFN